MMITLLLYSGDIIFQTSQKSFKILSLRSCIFHLNKKLFHTNNNFSVYLKHQHRQTFRNSKKQKKINSIDQKIVSLLWKKKTVNALNARKWIERLAGINKSIIGVFNIIILQAFTLWLKNDNNNKITTGSLGM